MRDTLFEMPKASTKKISVLPVSVVEIGEQFSLLREDGGHNSDSSRGAFSSFPSEVASMCYELFLRDCQNIFDPFAGWGERHCSALQFGKNYTGYDINPEAIKFADENFGVKNTLANSLSDTIPAFDGLITCPPYWNLEVYSDQGIEARKTWREFLAGYGSILSGCSDAAKPGATFCIMVGDWRDGGTYYDLAHQTRNALSHCGLTQIDEVIVSRSKISKIKVMAPQALRLGYTVKVHETLLVYRKPL